MDDRRVEIFLATIKAGSFSKAAEITNCSQSAITQIMNNFEAELNCKLLERNHSGVRLTTEGEKLLPFILDTDKSIKRLQNQAKIVSAQKEIPIRIGSFSSIANMYLPQIIKEYQKANPNVIFDIRIGTDILPAWLLNNEIDIALGDQDRLNGFLFSPILEDPYYAVIPKEIMMPNNANIISQLDVIKLPFIMAPMNALKKHLIEIPYNSVNVVCDDDSTLLAMVSQGLGVTIMPKLSLKQIPDNVKISELNPPTNRIIGIGLPHTADKKTVKFSKFIVKYFDMLLK